MPPRDKLPAIRTSSLELVLRNGVRLTPADRLVIEGYRRGYSDEKVCELIGTTYTRLFELVNRLRQTLGVSYGAALVDGADRHRIPTIDLGRVILG